MKTMGPLGYHHNGFMATYVLVYIYVQHLKLKIFLCWSIDHYNINLGGQGTF